MIESLAKLKSGLGVEFYFVDLDVHWEALEKVVREGRSENVVEE